MRRRRFLVESSRAVASLSLLPMASHALEKPLSATVQEVVPEQALVGQIEKALPKLMQEMSVPGISIAVIKDAKVLWRGTFGVKDRASQTPVDHDTIFEAASVSKTVFAYAALKACENGLIGLDTPLSKYGAKPFLEGDSRVEQITARHVLSHTGGFQNWRSDDNPLKIHFTPGEKYSYSGEGYCYLQSVITHLTRQPIEAFMRAKVFAPFGMNTSGYVWNDTFERRAARPHSASGQPENNRKRTPDDAIRYAAAGDLHTTPSEYAKFLIEVIDPKPADDFRLSEATLKEMVRPHVRVSEFKSWGLGWEIPKIPGGGMIQHGGDNYGFHAYACASVTRKSGVIIMTNGENGFKLISHPSYLDPMVKLVSG